MFSSLIKSVCPNLNKLIIYHTVPISIVEIQCVLDMIAPNLAMISIFNDDGSCDAGMDASECKEVEHPAGSVSKPAPIEDKEMKNEEKKVEREEEKEEVEETPTTQDTPILSVTSNGIEIKMWMKCDENSCVLDLNRSGSYDTFSDLSDCDTSVKVEYRKRMYTLPMIMETCLSALKGRVINVSVAVLFDC